MKSFLVVDDDSSMTELYKTLIERRYGDVLISQANNGKDALDKAIASDYSVILSDIDMPIMSGIDFHKILKGESPLSAKRTAFISGGPHKLDLEYVREENLPYLPKSFECDDFYGIIDAILEAEGKKSGKESGSGCQRKYEKRAVRGESVLEPVTKILLVDDVRISIEMGKIALSSFGATILTACNGREALEIVKKEMPDIVLCDVYMPEMNGDELCKAIKADSSLKNIPVILFSSYSDDKDTRAKYFRSGCDDILVKPYQKQELLSMIKKHVDLSTRKHKRKPVNIEVDCHIVEVDYHASKEVVPGRVVDMSIGGMLVKSKTLFPLDAYIEFTVFIDGHSNGIPAKGKVVWSDRQYMGVQFLFTPNYIENFLSKTA